MSKETKRPAGKQTAREQKFFNKWRSFFQFLITHICYMIRFRLVYRLEVQGRENMPETNDYIVAANHLSTLDPPLVCSVMKRPLAYMAKKELFENPFLRWWLNWLGAFAVDREKLGVSTIKTVMTIKKTGWVLGIFPQGTRQEPGCVSNITKGFASLAKTTKCGILPVGIIGTQDAKRIPFSGKIIVKIGKLIPYTDNVDEMVEQWGNAIAELTGFRYEPAAV